MNYWYVNNIGRTKTEPEESKKFKSQNKLLNRLSSKLYINREQKNYYYNCLHLATTKYE